MGEKRANIWLFLNFYDYVILLFSSSIDNKNITNKNVAIEKLQSWKFPCCMTCMVICLIKKNLLLLIPRCPKEVYPHVPTVISICLKYLTYDPNYNYDDEDEDENAMDADGVDEDYQGTRRGSFLLSV